MVEHCLREAGVVRSNRAIPTISLTLVSYGEIGFPLVHETVLVTRRRLRRIIVGPITTDCYPSQYSFMGPIITSRVMLYCTIIPECNRPSFIFEPTDIFFPTMLQTQLSNNILAFIWRERFASSDVKERIRANKAQMDIKCCFARLRMSSKQRVTDAKGYLLLYFTM